jgi:hypothetical protein
MGVAIDQPRRDPAAVEGDAVDRVPTGRQFRHRTREGDPSRRRGDGAVLDHAQAGTVGRERGKACVEPDRVEPHVILARPFLYT